MILLPEFGALFHNPPLKRYTLLTGGRGSSKSWHIALAMVNLTYLPGHVILYTRWTMVSAHISIIPEFIDKIEQLQAEEDFEINKTEIINKRTGSRIVFRGIKTSQGTATAALKSIAGVTTWVLDEAEELVDHEIFDKIDLSIRSQAQPNRVILAMNPSYKTHWIYQRMIERNDYDVTHVHTTYKINAHNLSQSFLDQAERTRQTNPARYAHQFMGEWLESAEGLLWNQALIDAHRVKVAPPLRRIVVAIDPAITHNANSDETGLVVVGSDKDNQLYVLEDNSGIYTPDQWGQVAKAMADRHNADAYIAEGNQGHDLVAANLQRIDRQRRVKMVRATRGKFVRAEPVYGAYERGEVHHVGYLPKLEQQMTTWNPTESKDSPDRVDALVWGVTELMQGGAQDFFIA
ncbi:MAG TPA: phage terminase large subunit [Marinagarivorans sp.]